MVIFIAVAAALCVAVSLLMLKFWHGRLPSSSANNDAEWQLLLAKRHELDTDPTLSDDLKASLRSEWARTADVVLARTSTASVNASHSPPSPYPQRHAWRMIAAVLASAIAVYALIGNWDSSALTWQWNTLAGPRADFEPAPPAGAAHPGSNESLDDRIATLEAKLQQAPNDIDGWVLLARSRGMQRDFAKAAEALDHALALAPGHPDLLADLADTLAMSANKSLAGRPSALIDQALRAEPTHRKALSLAATRAMQQNDTAQAVMYWKRLRATFPEGAPDIAQVDAILASLGSADTTPSTNEQATAPGKAIAGQVQLAPQLLAALKKQGLPDTAALFVLARMPGGPPMPVAALRLPVQALLQGDAVPFRLDDSQAPMPTQKLSNLAQADVEARISLAGVAGRQPGDLAVTVTGVKVGAADLHLVIASDK